MAYNSGRANITDSATLIVASNTGRYEVLITNNGENTIYLGTDNSVTDTTGFPLAAEGSYKDRVGLTDYYAICASAETSNADFTEQDDVDEAGGNSIVSEGGSASDFLPVITSPVSGQLLYYNNVNWVNDGTILFDGSGNATVSNNMIISGQAYSSLHTLTDEANIATDCDEGNAFQVTLTDNRTLDNPTNLKAGATYLWLVIQDVGGTNTLAYGNAFKFPGGTAPTLTTDGDAVDIISGISDGTNVYVNSVLDLR